MTGLSAIASGAARRRRFSRGDERGLPAARALSMLGNSVSLMIGKAGTMALGFAFWVVAARQFDQVEVGLAAGVVSAMMLCTQLAILGMGSAVISELPRRIARSGPLLDTAIVVVVGAAALGGVLFVLTASGVLHELSAVGDSPAFSVLFVAMCVLGTLGILFDQVSIALRRGDQVLVRGLVFGCVTVGLLVAIPRATDAEGALAIFTPWVAAGAVACTLAAIHVRRSLGRYSFRLRVDRALASRLARIGVPNYALTLTERAPGLVLPIIVIELLSPAANAAWYAVWMMAWVVFIIPISVGLALFAEGANSPDVLPHAVSQAVRAGLVLGIGAAATLAVFAPLALSILGAEYASAGSTPLRVLVWALVPLVFVQTYFAACRAENRLGEAIAVGTASGLAAVLAAAVAGAAAGLTAMAIAWVVVNAATGCFALVRVRALARGSRDAAVGSLSRGVPTAR